LFSLIFEKIFKYFSVCHVHPNNYCGIVELGDIKIPQVIEVTFIRNDLIGRFRRDDDVVLPHELDRRNAKKKPDLIMPEIWWKSNFDNE